MGCMCTFIFYASNSVKAALIVRINAIKGRLLWPVLGMKYNLSSILKVLKCEHVSIWGDGGRSSKMRGPRAKVQ